MPHIENDANFGFTATDGKVRVTTIDKVRDIRQHPSKRNHVVITLDSGAFECKLKGMTYEELLKGIERHVGRHWVDDADDSDGSIYDAHVVGKFTNRKTD